VSEDKGKPKRPVWATVSALAAVAVIALGIGILSFRPATLVGVHADALAYSVGGGSLLTSDRCSEVGDSRWRCLIRDDEDSATAEYRVETRAFGCWDATRRGPGGEGGTPKRASGCIDLSNVLGAP
jgi:hypothetical protein